MCVVLFVSVPPQKIVITNESGAQLTSVVGPFPEGASFTLRCDVFGGEIDNVNDTLKVYSHLSIYLDFSFMYFEHSEQITTVTDSWVLRDNKSLINCIVDSLKLGERGGFCFLLGYLSVLATDGYRLSGEYVKQEDLFGLFLKLTSYLKSFRLDTEFVAFFQISSFTIFSFDLKFHVTEFVTTSIII